MMQIGKRKKKSETDPSIPAWSRDCHTARGSIGLGATCSVWAHACAEAGQTGCQGHSAALESTCLSHAGESTIHIHILYIHVHVQDLSTYYYKLTKALPGMFESYL